MMMVIKIKMEKATVLVIIKEHLKVQSMMMYLVILLLPLTGPFMVTTTELHLVM